MRQKEREYNAWLSDRRKAKMDKWREEKEKKKAEAMDVQPHVAEMTLIEQTILFCKTLVQDKGPAQKEEKKEVTHSNPDGTEILLRKEDREEEFYYAPTASKKKGKSKNKGAKDGGAKPIKHNAETFKLFDQLKLSAPITTEDIPSTLEKLEEQLETYKEKVKAWEKNRDEKNRKILSGEIVDEEEDAEEEAVEEEKEGQEDEKEEEEK